MFHAYITQFHMNVTKNLHVECFYNIYSMRLHTNVMLPRDYADIGYSIQFIISIIEKFLMNEQKAEDNHNWQDE